MGITEHSSYHFSPRDIRVQMSSQHKWVIFKLQILSLQPSDKQTGKIAKLRIERDISLLFSLCSTSKLNNYSGSPAAESCFTFGKAPLIWSATKLDVTLGSIVHWQWLDMNGVASYCCLCECILVHSISYCSLCKLLLLLTQVKLILGNLRV